MVEEGLLFNISAYGIARFSPVNDCPTSIIHSTVSIVKNYIVDRLLFTYTFNTE